MTISFVTVADSISKIRIAGVKIADINEVKVAVNERDCPLVFPEPVNFISNFTVRRDSYGSPSAGLKTATYTMRYTFAYSPIGAGRELEKFRDVVAVLARILDALILADDLLGTVEFSPQGAFEFGPVPDPAGNMFFGCRILVGCTEFIN